ncbi:MAG: discoidin domain-containing protein [Sedimentisphaerales bacterium]|nr:discoidin domain-containing protein [Sedimentisphaerales bacterium]
MAKKLICFVSLVLFLSMAGNTSAELVALWKLDDGTGTIAKDSVGSYDGTLMGDTRWAAGHLRGALEFDGDGDYVDCGNEPVFNPAGSFSVAYWAYIRDWGVAWGECMIGKGGDNNRGGWTVRRGGGQTIMFTIAGAGGNHTGNQTPPLEEWIHITAVYDQENGFAYIYFNAEEALNSPASGTVDTTDNSLYLGTRGNDDGVGPDAWGDAFFNGLLDDVRFYDHALSQAEITQVMQGEPMGQPSKPKPANGSPNIPRDGVNLSWTPGEFADTHNVYLGTIYEDVNNADTSSPLLVSPAQDANNYVLGRLEFGQTYFWRIDEVNAPPDTTTYKGKIWSFTVEPYSSRILSENIIATASSQISNRGPENTIDNAGLDDNDLQSTDTSTMWLTPEGQTGPVWIQYEFDKPYKLHEMMVWNYNGETILSWYGLKEVTVEYSTDGTNWETIPNISEFAKAPGTENYASDITVAFDGIAAKFVRITATSNWSKGFFDQYGLSEVRFMQIPVSAGEPNPDDAATDIAIDTTLSWKAGREAAEHNVYISTNQQAIIDNTVSVTTVSQNIYGPLSLDLGITYYWRVDEVNNAEVHPVWEGGIWSFTTSEYLVVEDFESYNDILQGEEGSNLVYLTWVDGYDNPTVNGSTMGYTQGSSLETNITRAGSNHSVPLMYNNSVASSSTVTASLDDLAIGRDWTVGSPETFVLWAYGDPNNSTTDQMYVEIANKKVPFEGNLTRTGWQEFSIELADLGINLSNVTTLTIGIERTGATGGSGMVFIDDIRLYHYAQPLEEPADESVVFNPSFEDDGEAAGTPSGWVGNNVPGGVGTSSGEAVSATDGSYYLWQGNGNFIYQTTDEVIAADGLSYLLQVDARNSWMASPKIIIYYEDAGNRVELASSSLPANGNSWAQPITMEVTAVTTAASVGKKLGIELTIDNYPGDVWAHYDNVRLSLVQ